VERRDPTQPFYMILFVFNTVTLVSCPNGS
jgi:hypothetical protein